MVQRDRTSDLQPETSDAYDVGFVFRNGEDQRGEIGLTYFDQDTTNLITFSFRRRRLRKHCQRPSRPAFELQAQL